MGHLYAAPPQNHPCVAPPASLRALRCPQHAAGTRPFHTPLLLILSFLQPSPSLYLFLYFLPTQNTPQVVSCFSSLCSFHTTNSFTQCYPPSPYAPPLRSPLYHIVLISFSAHFFSFNWSLSKVSLKQQRWRDVISNQKIKKTKRYLQAKKVNL